MENHLTCTFTSETVRRSYQYGRSIIQPSRYGPVRFLLLACREHHRLSSCLRPDSNRDQRLDINEFRNLIAQNLGPNASIYLGNGSDEAGPYANASYGASGSPTYADINAYETGYENTNLGASGGGGGAAPGGQENFNSYEQSSYGSSAGLNSGGFDVSAASHADGTDAAALASSSSSYETSSTQHQVQQYATSAQGLYQDPNPQIIRRPATGGAVTYTQNIKIRFLQPPPIPPPGVSARQTRTVSLLPDTIVCSR